MSLPRDKSLEEVKEAASHEELFVQRHATTMTCCFCGSELQPLSKSNNSNRILCVLFSDNHNERSVSAPTTTAVLTESVLVDTLKLAQRYSSAAASRSSSGVQIEVPTSAAYQPQQQQRQKVQVEERNAKALLLPVSSPPPSYEPATTVSALDCYDLQQRRPSDNSCGWVSPSMSPPVEYRDPLHNFYQVRSTMTAASAKRCC